MGLAAAGLLLAWFIDALIGDPSWIPWPHPVVLIGRAASRLERRLRRPEAGRRALVVRGAVFWIATVGGAAAASGLALSMASRVHPLLGSALGIYAAYACLATRCLDTEARGVARLLDRKNLSEARRRLSGIVGRDTAGLSPPEVVRAAVETVAENASDGVIAPLFYLALGVALGCGPVLGVAYKAVNTLDSMVGYRDERYEYFGKVSAMMDDRANWLPARLTVLFAAAAAQLFWRSGRAAIEIAVRDGGLHKSPNSGFPEAAFAGALGVSLGGTNTYRGILRPSARLGNPGPELRPKHVYDSLQLLWGASVTGLVVFEVLLVLV